MNDLTQGSVTKHLLGLSGFMAVSMIFQTLYYLADLYFVGRLGKEAIAAVGLSGNLMIVVLAITQMLGVGTTPLVSHAVGRKDLGRAGVVFNQAFFLSQLVGIFVTVVGFALRHRYCAWLGADAVTARLGVEYLNWFLPAMLMQFVMVAMGAALRGSGIIKPAVGIQILTVLLNIALAPVLILGWGTGRPLGVQGAALATPAPHRVLPAASPVRPAGLRALPPSGVRHPRRLVPLGRLRGDPGGDQPDAHPA